MFFCLKQMCKSSEASSFTGRDAPTANQMNSQTCHLRRNGCKTPATSIGSPRIGAQKRPKPCSSVECSPDAGTNGHCGSNGFVSSQQPMAAQPVSNNSHSSNHNHHHDHSPSSCQAPIRLRLNTPDRADRPNSLCDVSQLPVYPIHHQCYKDERNSSMNSISLSPLNENNLSAHVCVLQPFLSLNMLFY